MQDCGFEDISDEVKAKAIACKTPEEILEVNIPTAIPLSYTFDQDWNVVDKHYIGDPDVIAAKIDAVANQGKAK